MLMVHLHKCILILFYIFTLLKKLFLNIICTSVTSSVQLVMVIKVKNINTHYALTTNKSRMFVFRVAGLIASFALVRATVNSPTGAIKISSLYFTHSTDSIRGFQKFYTSLSSKGFSINKKDWRKMVDPQRVVSYEDMLKVIHQPEKVIIDVRNPDEVVTTGKIPSSINIPLSTVQDALITMSDEEFKKQYQRAKPSSSDELIFYCQSGRRSTEALDKALKLGYTKSKTYLGSWNDWSSRHK